MLLCAHNDYKDHLMYKLEMSTNYRKENRHSIKYVTKQEFPYKLFALGIALAVVGAAAIGQGWPYLMQMPIFN